MNQIQLFKVFMNQNVDTVILPTLTSGMITQGKKVEEFENRIKEMFGHPYVLTLNSATSGLTLAYRLLDLDSERDTVISTPLTCFATTSAILANNLKIIWADTDPDTCNIDLQDVKEKINENTKVLSFVHWGGVPVDLDKVDELKKYTLEKYGNVLHVVEDCAHAFGSEFNNKKLGTHRNICVFSLQAIKHLTTGDGGLIFLPNEEMYKRAKLLRWFGIDRDRRSLPGSDFRLEPDISEYGYKFHMNDINASIGLANLPFINQNIELCLSNGRYYNIELKDIPGIALFNDNKKSNPSYWIYTLKILHNRKNEFIQFMKHKNIVVSQVHARNDTHSCVKEFKWCLPRLDILENEIVSIPVGWWLTTDNLKYIVDCIKEFAKTEVCLLTQSDIPRYRALMFQLNNYTQDCIENDPCVSNNIYVLKYGGKIVATAKLIIENKLYAKMGHIEDVVVGQNYRCRGFGKALIDKLINIALEHRDCYKVVLNCKDTLDDFYAKCGMTKTGSSFSVYKNKS